MLQYVLLRCVGRVGAIMASGAHCWRRRVPVCIAVIEHVAATERARILARMNALALVDTLSSNDNLLPDLATGRHVLGHHITASRACPSTAVRLRALLPRRYLQAMWQVSLMSNPRTVAWAPDGEAPTRHIGIPAMCYRSCDISAAGVCMYVDRSIALAP